MTNRITTGSWISRRVGQRRATGVAGQQAMRGGWGELQKGGAAGRELGEGSSKLLELGFVGRATSL